MRHCQTVRYYHIAQPKHSLLLVDVCNSERKKYYLSNEAVMQQLNHTVQPGRSNSLGRLMCKVLTWRKCSTYTASINSADARMACERRLGHRHTQRHRYTAMTTLRCCNRSTGNDSIVMSNNAMNRQKLWNYIYQEELHYPDWSWSTVATETTIDRLSGKL